MYRWNHIPIFHVNHSNQGSITQTCPICHHDFRSTLQVHIHEHHSPRRDVKPGLTQIYTFALAIIKHPSLNLYLLCQEFANNGFWCPGGAVDNGEVLRMQFVASVIVSLLI